MPCVRHSLINSVAFMNEFFFRCRFLFPPCRFSYQSLSISASKPHLLFLVYYLFIKYQAMLPMGILKCQFYFEECDCCIMLNEKATQKRMAGDTPLFYKLRYNVTISYDVAATSNVIRCKQKLILFVVKPLNKCYQNNPASADRYLLLPPIVRI